MSSSDTSHLIIEETANLWDLKGATNDPVGTKSGSGILQIGNEDETYLPYFEAVGLQISGINFALPDQHPDTPTTSSIHDRTWAA